MQVKTVGIIGYGHFGAFLADLAQRFLPEVEVRVHSRRKEMDGKRFYDFETTCQSDVVVVAGAIHEFEEQLLEVLKHASEETIIVDVATVKIHTVNLLKKHASNRNWIATHPMFGPEGFKKAGEKLTNLPLVVTEHTLNADVYGTVRTFLNGIELNLIEMSTENHDKILAETLFLTHYIGQTMKVAGFTRTEIDTPSFASLMSAVESVAHDENLFKDVYRFNSYCKRAAKRFHDAQEDVFKKLG